MVATTCTSSAAAAFGGTAIVTPLFGLGVLIPAARYCRTLFRRASIVTNRLGAPGMGPSSPGCQPDESANGAANGWSSARTTDGCAALHPINAAAVIARSPAVPRTTYFLGGSVAV